MCPEAWRETSLLWAHFKAPRYRVISLVTRQCKGQSRLHAYHRHTDKHAEKPDPSPPSTLPRGYGGLEGKG